MKNLVLLSERRHNEVDVVDICHVSDGHQESALVLTKDGRLISQTWTKTLPSSSKWFSATHVDPQIVCLSKQGAIVSVQPESGECELVGEFDHGILAGKWSPDAEVLALVTMTENDQDGSKNGVLLTMSADFEVIGEVDIAPFDPMIPVELSWRPNGELFVINSFEMADSTQRIRTYKRDTLELHSVGRSEDGSGKTVPNLNPCVAWASSGCSNLIASVQRKTKKTQRVVFFEPNGLRHTEFTLRSPQATVQLLCWNALSDLLAIVLQEENGVSLQLWHRSNYHWYLKYEWQYESPVSCVLFHEEQPYRLFVGFSTCWREYLCCWDVSTLALDCSTAYVIDGSNLNMTPFDRAFIPPPMCAATLTFDHCVLQVAAYDGCDHAVVYLSNGQFALVGPNQGTKSEMVANFDVPQVLGLFEWQSVAEVDTGALRHLTVVESTPSHIIMLAVHPSSELVEMQLDLTKMTIAIRNTLPVEDHVLRISNWADNTEGAFVELDDGTLLEYSQGSILPLECEPLLEPCPWLSGLRNASVSPNNDGNRMLIVGLSARSRLYCHDRMLSAAVSSFILSTEHSFLCFATAGSHCELRSLALSSLLEFDPLMGSDDQNLEGYEVRNVERGAKLVCILPQKPTAILQMPRGNLEGIYPRALVLPYVMSKINNREYGLAFSTMRRQKVDLNLIVDLDPVRFLATGMSEFIEEIHEADSLNLFISTLQDTDSTEHRYRVPEWISKPIEDDEKATFDFSTKVNQVCHQLRCLFLEAEQKGCTLGGRTIAEGQYLLPVLSTYAKEVPPKLEKALSMIREKAVSQHPPNSKKIPLLSETAQSSIKYLAFLADYKYLYNTALGMYDFDLARAVARNSQMDPKVYLPYLKSLRALPQFYAKFEVDTRLERYESALANLYKSGEACECLENIESAEASIRGNDFDSCLSVIEKYGLHRLGLQLFSDDQKRGHIMKSLGEDMLGKKNPKAALSVFLVCDPPDYDGAKRAARMCGDWKYYFTHVIDVKDDMSPENAEIRRQQIAKEIADEIAAGQGGSTQKESLFEASRILLDYASDVVAAVEMLVSAEMWSEGRRLAAKHGREDLCKRIADGAVTHANNLIDELSDREVTFAETTSRYIEVLKIRKEAVRESGLDPGDELNQADDSGSLFSVASTSSLRSTASTGSVGSVGSVASVSSVISVGKQSTFSMSVENDRHKSKFNSLGGKKKDKKKKKRNNKKSRARPGSPEELKSLIATLKATCADADYAAGVGDTAIFLSQVGHVEVAREVFDAYLRYAELVRSTQVRRIETAAKERRDEERKARMEGYVSQPIILPCEVEVDSLLCKVLSPVLADLFFYL